jgi:hypothetical protein
VRRREKEENDRKKGGRRAFIKTEERVEPLDERLPTAENQQSKRRSNDVGELGETGWMERAP